MVRRKIVEYFGLESTVVLFYCINAGEGNNLIYILKLKDVIANFNKAKNAQEFRVKRTKRNLFTIESFWFFSSCT